MSCAHNEHDEHDEDCATEIETFYADYVVVGAGTAGAPIIRRLADAGFSVHAIEGGADLRRDPAVLQTEGEVTGIPAYQYDANIAPIAPGPAALVPYAEGRLWGGSSGHNFFLGVRGTPAIWDKIARSAGSSRYAYRNVLPLMIGLETYTPLATGFFDPSERGNQGPLFLTQLEPALSPGDPLVAASAIALDAPYSADYNDPNLGTTNVGDAQAFVNPTTRERSWSASAFLPEDVVARTDDGNGVGLGGRCIFIASRSLADRILFEDDLPAEVVNRSTGTSAHRRQVDERHGRRESARLTARGVLYTRPDGTIARAIAGKRVILAAGAIGDPALLIRSGIGPCETLERLGFEPRLVNENVGKNLQNHVGALIILATPGGVDLEASPVIHFETEPDGVRKFQLLSGGVIAPGLALYVASFLQPGRTGVVEPKGDTEADGVRIDFNFYQDPQDREDVVRLLKRIGDLSIEYTRTDSSPGTLPILPDPSIYPAAEYAAYGGQAPDDSALFEYATSSGNGVVFNHAAGTARMARSARDGVVDADMNVFGIANLSVSSNSVAPEINDGNTAYPAYIYGLLKAGIELGDLPVPDGEECGCS